MSFAGMARQKRQGRVAGSRLAYMLPLILLCVVFAVYRITLAPDLTWAHGGADGGDLITAAYRLGIPHPTGYPLYVLLGHLFTHSPAGNIAFRLHLMSAISAAVAVVFFLGWARAEAFAAGAGSVSWADVAALSAALLLAFSPLFWSQAIIAEVYALNALFTAALLYLLWQWEASGRRSLLPLLSFLYGLGLGNHLTLLLLLPGMLYLIWSSPQRLAITRHVALATAGAFLAGLCVYLYLPVRAAADPWPNWGDPTTLRRFLWVTSGAIYRHYLFGVPLAAWPLRLTAWARHLLAQFGPCGVILGAIGLAVGMRGRRRVAIATLLTFGLYTVYALGYNTPDAWVNLIPAHIIWAFWVASGVWRLLDRAGLTAASKRGLVRAAAIALLGLLPLWSFLQNLPRLDLHADREARDYLESAAQLLPRDTVIITGSDGHTFALWYLQEVEHRRGDLLVLDRDLVRYDWYRAQIATRAGEALIPPGEIGTADWWREVVATLSAQRPVALADPDPPLLASHAWRQEGPFYIWQAAN